MRQHNSLKIDENSIKNISKDVAKEVTNKIYYEFLFMRHVPEIQKIEKGSIVPITIEDFKRQLKRKINLAE